MNRTCLPWLLGLMARVAINVDKKCPNDDALSDLLCMLEVIGYDYTVVGEAMAIAYGEASPEWLVEYRMASSIITQARAMRRGQA